MFNLTTFLTAVEHSDFNLITQQLDSLLDEYFEGNANKAFYDFRFAYQLMPEILQVIYKANSAFSSELQIYPHLTA